MRASSSRQGICSLLPDTYYLLRVVTALCCESDALSQARPGTRGVVAVGRRANHQRTTTDGSQKYPRRRRHQHAAVRYVWFWPSHSCLPSPRISPSLCSAKTPRGHTLAAKHTQGVVPVSLCMAVASYSGHAACPVLPACMPQRRACVAWISGHPLRKAPTVDRTAPGIVVACHGMAWPCAYRLLLRLFPGIGVSRRGGGK